MTIPHDNQMKRVWALYRVSTKEQNVEIQREKCREYCKKFPNWNLENELVEKLSGFKTPVEQRDTLTYLAPLQNMVNLIYYYFIALTV